ncbi:MAG: META domain-containing protein [Herpetosiphonaceae bacterium]|nr:META domain-containing protein [Herpetosiphonaceae bacterium]
MRRIILGILLLLVVGCSAAEPSPAATSTPATANLLTGQWQLSALAGQPPLGTTPLTLSVAENGMASGNGGCNQFSSTITLTESTIAFTPIIATRRACADPSLNNQEAAYLAALESARSFQIDGATLRLLDAQNTPLGEFVRQ